MRIVFIGTGEIGVPTLQALLKSEHEIVAVVTQPDKPVGRAQLVEASAIKKALTGGAAGGRPLSLPILQPARIKERQAIEEIRALKPDVIVVMAYGQILPRDVLDIPQIACLNLHASLLPRWRGAAPIQAAIAAGEFVFADYGQDGSLREFHVQPLASGATFAVTALPLTETFAAVVADWGLLALVIVALLVVLLSRQFVG